MSVSHTNRVQRTSKTRRIYEQCVDLSDLDLLGLGHAFRQMALRMGLTSSQRAAQLDCLFDDFLCKRIYNANLVILEHLV